MGQNILITGAAGYIGGSVLADFLSRTSGLIKDAKVSAVVRSSEQVQLLSTLGINVIHVELSDEAGVNKAIVENEIDIVVHTASSIDGRLASHLIKALGQRHKATGKGVYFIHSSVTTIYSTEGGWPHGPVKDTDTIYEKEKQIEQGHPVRDTNILVTELAKEQGVISIILVVSYIYGRGTGECRKLSVNIPAYVRASKEHKVVYKFDKDGSPPATHISDLVRLYGLLVGKILQKEPIPTGENGYYFAMAHRLPWWKVMERLAAVMHVQGLVTSPEVKTWPSYELAAETLRFPLLYLPAMGTSTGDLIPVNAFKLGWQPIWTEGMLLESIDDEVQAALESDNVNMTLFDALTK